MFDYDNLFFNVAAFVGGLFVLEYGADTFIDHTAKVASRLGVSPTLIALLTAGAEWEELAVVVAAISQQRSSLALGNILGSSISNILGAFSLGLIFSPTDVVFDRSSKIYTSLLLALTSAFVTFLVFFRWLSRIGGAILVATFVIYICSIGYCIYKGVVAPPEDDDGDGDSDSNSDSERGDDARSLSLYSNTTLRDEDAAHHESIALVDNGADPKLRSHNVQVERHSPHSLFYHVIQLILGFMALSLSGYLLSHSVSTIADTLSLSGDLIGITILSFATTLPEKLVAVFGGARSQSGIVVANTAGSNIFLLTLCAGVLFLVGDLEVLKGNVEAFEVATIWVSSLLLFIIVIIGGRRWMGFGLLGLYLGFIVLEFTLYRR